MKTNTRYEWVDVLKFLGIFFIYLGHFANNAGKFYLFVFQFHVPLFFLTSGFFFNIDKYNNIFDFIRNEIKKYIIPYFILNFIYILVYSIAGDFGLNFILSEMLKTFTGIRNLVLAGATWFIPCLFVVKLYYYIICKLTKNKYFKLFISLFLYLLATYLLPNNPLIKPSLFWNIDSALCYLLYFSIGNITFPFIKRLLNGEYNKNFVSKFSITILSLASLLIGVTLFYKDRTIFGMFLAGKWYFVFDIIFTLLLIYDSILIAKFLSKIKLFQNIGKETLYLCLTENLSKYILITIFTLTGISINLFSPFATIIYTLFVIFVNYKFLIPYFEKFVSYCVKIIKESYEKNCGNKFGFKWFNRKDNV